MRRRIKLNTTLRNPLAIDILVGVAESPSARNMDAYMADNVLIGMLIIEKMKHIREVDENPSDIFIAAIKGFVRIIESIAIGTVDISVSKTEFFTML